MSFLSDLLGNAYKEGMTEEEISKALEEVQGTSAKELIKTKNALTKSNAEAAEYKRQLRAKQSADEVAEAERKAEHDRIVEENAKLSKQVRIMELSSSLVGQGYELSLAQETATAMAEGDMTKVLANQSKFLDAQKAQIKADLMKSTPRPGAGASVQTDYTKEKEEALANGEYSKVAYYTRLEQQITPTE